MSYWPSDVPENAEELPRSDYSKLIERKSSLVPGKKQLSLEECHCPRCNEVVSMEHGERVDHHCGLSWVAYGNCLYAWETKCLEKA